MKSAICMKKYPYCPVGHGQGCAFSAIFRGKLCGNYAVEIRNCAVLCGKEKTHFIAFY